MLSRVPAKARMVLVAGSILATVAAGVLRTLGTVTAYQAPMGIYEPLHRPEFAKLDASVCLGKEWYRFPSSFFLPKNMRARFVKSEFRGLLPGQFAESGPSAWGLPRTLTWLVPTGMNDENIEDPRKYVCLHTRF